MNFQNIAIGADGKTLPFFYQEKVFVFPKLEFIQANVSSLWKDILPFTLDDQPVYLCRGFTGSNELLYSTSKDMLIYVMHLPFLDFEKELYLDLCNVNHEKVKLTFKPIIH